MAISEIETGTSNPLGGEYQVFLSFRGPDTRHGFADTLYNFLVDAGIHVFRDFEELREGERIGGSLLRAIDDSRLYIPIFSPNYASSHWCLREIAKMVENTSKSTEDGNKKVILPIFYNVIPDDVKLRTQLYSKDILNLEQMMEDQKKKFSLEDVETWREALRGVGGISGFDLQNYTGDGHLSKSVVNEVMDRLKTRWRETTEDLVGMEDRIAAMNKLLDIDSRGVRLLGIYGMGGMGKTTLAKKIFNQLCPRFGKRCSFIDDVRETAKTKGLIKLQEQLLSDISNSRVARNIANSEAGTKAIEDTICNKEALIVLDDVDDSNQIRKLIGMSSLYPGTRILVTTRDSGVLNIRGFKYSFEHYEPKGLSDEDSLQLFSRHAFDDDSPPSEFYTLSKGIVSTAGGLPLALQAIGALLFGQKKIKIWEERLRQLRKTPDEDVLDKLKISYDTLKTDQKQIFLDVACFFIGEEMTEPIFVWEDCGFSPAHDIDVLIKRCMIKVLNNNRFWMHDQFRDLGRAIAREEHTRLWDRDDIICELRSTKIKRSVQALWLQDFAPNPITVTANVIEKFPNLQFLWLINVNCHGDFLGCLSKLKWISLWGGVFNSARKWMKNTHLENVVVMRTSGYEWTDDAVGSLIEGARKLKVLTLDYVSIRKTPTFSINSVLEKLTISDCEYLTAIDCSTGNLRQLTYLRIYNCRALQNLHEQIGKLKNLQHLSLITCPHLSGFMNSASQLVSLTELKVLDTKIVSLPEDMSKLTRLQTLKLDECHEIRELPELPKNLTALKLRSSSLEIVPDLSNLTNLVELFLSDASEGRYGSNIIPTRDLPWIGRLSKLRRLHLCLLNVHATLTEWESLSLLEELLLFGLHLQKLKQLSSNLTYLFLESTHVKQVQLDGLPQLETLTIGRCELIERLSFPPSLTKLRDVVVNSCNKLVEVQFLGVLKSMKSLSIWDCKSFERLICLSEESGCNELQAPKSIDGRRGVYLDSSSLKMLRRLQLWGCPELQEIQFVSTLEAFKYVYVQRCISLKRLGGLSNLKNLECLVIGRSESLRVVEGIDKLKLLGYLEVFKCGSLGRILDASSSKIPNECRISIVDCGQLLDSGSSTTWEYYREKIRNGPTETGDPLLEKGERGKDERGREHEEAEEEERDRTE